MTFLRICLYGICFFFLITKSEILSVRAVQHHGSNGSPWISQKLHQSSTTQTSHGIIGDYVCRCQCLWFPLLCVTAWVWLSCSCVRRIRGGVWGVTAPAATQESERKSLSSDRISSWNSSSNCSDGVSAVRRRSPIAKIKIFILE